MEPELLSWVSNTQYQLYIFWGGNLQYLHPIAHSINVWGSVLKISNSNTKDTTHIVMSNPLWKHDHRKHDSIEYT